MKRKQGGSDDADEDAQRCPPHPAFVLGRCFLCGMKENGAEVGVPRVAVKHETLKQGGDDDGGDDNDSARFPPHPEIVQSLGYQCGAMVEDPGGSASGVTVANIDRVDRVQAALAAAKSIAGSDLERTLMRQMEEDAEGAAPRVPLAPCPSGRVLPFLGLGGTKEEGSAERGASGEIREDPAAVPASTTTTTSTSIPHASDLETLLCSRKLTLVLDLDHTLLNSTGLDNLSPAEQAKGFTPDRSGDPRIGLFRLDSDNLGMLVKLRPLVRGFLEEASSMFEMHVYTRGNQVYAKAAIHLLDPNGVYFGGRVVSRDESTQGGTKSLDVIPGADPVAAVILDALDDTDVAWPGHQDNLILTNRYRYFASTCRKFSYDIPSMAEQGRDEGEHGGSLAVALGVLTRVHHAFFDGDRADVREVIREVRRQVLSECTVVFSYLDQRMEDSPDDTRLWTLAEQLGAVCRKNVDETVTHVVMEDPVTVGAVCRKAQWARDKGKFLVSQDWIKAASFRWCRQDEQEFPLTTRRVKPIEMVGAVALYGLVMSARDQRKRRNQEH